MYSVLIAALTAVNLQPYNMTLSYLKFLSSSCVQNGYFLHRHALRIDISTGQWQCQ